MVEEGLIGLDDAVHTHIPSWKDLSVHFPAFLARPVLTMR